MAIPTVKVSDLLEEARVTIDASGMKAVRKFLVEGIDGQPANNKLFFATETAGIPQYNSQHPSKPFLFATNIEATTVSRSANKAYVTVTYTLPSPNNQNPST